MQWNDDGSVTSGSPAGTTTITNSNNGWVTIYPTSVVTSPTWVEYDCSYTEIWTHSAVVDSAPVCLKRPLPPFARTKVTWTFIEPTCEVVDLITGNPRQTRAPPSVRVA